MLRAFHEAQERMRVFAAGELTSGVADDYYTVD
jgi:hypothetical protein